MEIIHSLSAQAKKNTIRAFMLVALLAFNAETSNAATLNIQTLESSTESIYVGGKKKNKGKKKGKHKKGKPDCGAYG